MVSNIFKHFGTFHLSPNLGPGPLINNKNIQKIKNILKACWKALFLFKIMDFHTFEILEKRVPGNDEVSCNNIFNFLDMGPISTKKPEWNFGSMVPISTRKLEMAFL